MISETQRLIIRNWKDSDFDTFHRLNSDEDVMHFFPWRCTLEQSDEKFKVIKQELRNSGIGFAALEEKASGLTVGMCGLLKTNLGTVVPDGTIEIGWRLLPPCQGKGFATEAARAVLDYGFEKLGVQNIVALAVHNNFPSIRVMQRIEMTHVGMFDHPRVPDTHPALKPHVLYRKVC